jgi:hypothetical protein
MMYCNSLFKFVRSWYFYDFKYVNEAWVKLLQFFEVQFKINFNARFVKL